jgi:uncharacterized protein (UPF0335 family)
MSDQTPKAGHNAVGGIDSTRLMIIVSRVENMEVERKAVAEQIKDLFTEAGSAGFDVKTLRQVIRLRAMDANKRDEADHLLELYRRAVGL